MLFLLFACVSQQPPAEKTVAQEPEEVVLEEKVVAQPAEQVDEIIEPEENKPPEITTAQFTVQNPTIKDEIRLNVVAKDPEGWVIRYDYSWSINGKTYPSETREFLRKKKVRKGDKIKVIVSASDEKNTTQKTVETTVGNSPPEWVQDPSTQKITSFDGVSVQAIDPDGDRISYKLQGQPKGMKISSSGKLSYLGSKQEPGGQYTISVIAEDPDGAQVKWVFSISLSAGSGAKK